MGVKKAHSGLSAEVSWITGSPYDEEEEEDRDRRARGRNRKEANKSERWYASEG